MNNATDRQITYILRMVQDCRRLANDKSAHGKRIVAAATNFTSKDVPTMTQAEASEIIETLSAAMEVFGANDENVFKAAEAIENMRMAASMEVKVTKYD